MSAQQQLVGAAGLGLVVANVWTDRADWSGVLGQGATSQAHAAAKQLGAELIGVTALVLIAGTSPSAGGACLVVLTCLWVLWLIHHVGRGGPGGPTDPGRRTGGTRAYPA